MLLIGKYPKLTHQKIHPFIQLGGLIHKTCLAPRLGRVPGEDVPSRDGRFRISNAGRAEGPLWAGEKPGAVVPHQRSNPCGTPGFVLREAVGQLAVLPRWHFVWKHNEPLQNIGVIFRCELVDVTTHNTYNRDMSYEWDEQKRQINVKKHGVDFNDVPEVFDGDTVTIPDERFDYGENRFIVIGILKNMVVVVVYTERGENIRIISARKATKNEQIYYFQQISN
jgi:uncharacterized DUF497 family protein